MLTNREIEQRLVGRELDCVSFVRDYVELRFDYDIIRPLAVLWLVEANGSRFTFPEPGSRDALCRRIDASILSAEIQDGSLLTLRLSDGSTIGVALEGGISAESAHFIPSNERGDLQGEAMRIW